MTKQHLLPFVAGFGIGAAAAVLLAPNGGGKTRGRITQFVQGKTDALKRGGQDIGSAAVEALDRANVILNDQRKTSSELMGNPEETAKHAIGDASVALERAVDKVVASPKEAAHSAGKTREDRGKRLQDA